MKITAITPPTLHQSTPDAGSPHILLVLDQFPETLGGGERIVLRLAALLPSYGYRVSILTFFVHPSSHALDSASCPIYLLPLRRTYDFSAFRAALEFRRFLADQQIRIVQTFFESSDIWAGLVTKTMPDIALIWSRRDLGILRGRKHRIAYCLMANAPNAVFAVSDQVRRHCIEVDGIPDARVYTVHNGLDLENWSGEVRHTRNTDQVLIVTVGNIRRVKGHDVLVRAAQIVTARFPGAVFSVAGDVLESDYSSELTNLIEELGLADKFRFEGGVANLRKFLSGADVFVLPSRSEGFSNAIIEAMAASLPIVATDVGGNAEAVKDGVTGLLVAPEDHTALADAICLLIANSPLAISMGEAGKKYVGEKFTTDAMMRQMVAVYGRLIAEEARA